MSLLGMIYATPVELTALPTCATSLIPYKAPLSTEEVIRSAYQCVRGDWLSYSHHLTDRQLRTRQLAIQALESTLKPGDLDSCCIGITGSDARCEKDSDAFSPMELVLIAASLESSRATAGKIEALIESSSLFLKSSLDLQILNAGSYAQLYIEKICMPMRGLETQYLMGDSHLFTAYQGIYYEQLLTLPLKEYTRYKKKFVFDAFKETAKVTKGNSQQCDLDRGSFCVNDKRLRGAKYAFLRTIQYIANSIIMDKLRDKSISLAQWLEMPLPLTHRILWLKSERHMEWSSQPIEKIQDAYHAALVWHQMAIHQHATRMYQLPRLDHLIADGSSPFHSTPDGLFPSKELTSYVYCADKADMKAVNDVLFKLIQEYQQQAADTATPSPPAKAPAYSLAHLEELSFKSLSPPALFIDTVLEAESSSKMRCESLESEPQSPLTPYLGQLPVRLLEGSSTSLA